MVYSDVNLPWVYNAVNPTRKDGVIESRQAIAARNADEILDAAERLLGGGRPLSFSALAAESGLSRPTVYGHFADRGRLCSALLERSVRRAVAAIEAAGPDQGSPVDALRRVVDGSWEHLARHHEIARAVAADATGESVHAAHHDALMLFERLVQRGRSEGAFRQDLPSTWLVHACVGLIHTAAAAVHAGQMDPADAVSALSTSVVELCTGPGTGGPRPSPRQSRGAK